MPTLPDADQLLSERKFLVAKEYYKDVIDEEPNNALAYQGLAQCLYSLNELDKALSVSQNALSINPNLAIPYVIIGQVYLQLQKYEDAENQFLRALELDPDLLSAQISLGVLHLRKDNTQQSISVLQRAIEIDSNSWIAHYNLGIANLRHNSIVDAYKEFKHAFILHPSLKSGGYTLLTFVASSKLLAIAITFIIFAVALSVRSLLTLPFFIISIAYLCWGVIYYFRLGKRTRSFLFFLICLLFVLLYIYQWL